MTFGFLNNLIEHVLKSILLSNEHQLLSEEDINKLNLEDLMSGGINLIIFSILIIMCANIANNVKQLFISICMSSSLRMKGQGIIIPLID